MTTFSSRIIVGVFVAGVSVFEAVFAKETPGTAVSISAQEGMPRAPRYRALFPNAPKVRVDGRTRGPGPDESVLCLTVLAPETVGFTTKEQPCLYWYQSKASVTRFVLTISEPKTIEPIMEVNFDDHADQSIHRICLADHNVKLKVGVEYRWSVAMVLEAENRSKDVLASGGIKRMEPPDTLQNRLKGATEQDLPYIYADEGLWYDSLEALSNIIDKKPAERPLHKVRAVYFMQAGLSEAAREEMRHASVTVSH